MSGVQLPPALAASPDVERLQVALEAVISAGVALVQLRGARIEGQQEGSQLKTAVDLAAEGWVLGLLEGSFPADRFLAEERHAKNGSWQASDEPYWTIDALDGTRSYAEGYSGFCVQVAFIKAGRPVLGVIAEPMAGKCFVGAEGFGAFQLNWQRGEERQLARRNLGQWPRQPRFVDSTLPGGAVGEIMSARGGAFVECGSVGLKICRVATGEADVYAKAFTFRLWDVAPAEVLLREVGVELRLWSGEPIDYSGRKVEFSNPVAAPAPLLASLLAHLQGKRR